jgi:hypothetical protein
MFPSQVAAPQQPPTALDVQAFLGTCSDEELRTMRVLSHLCAQTYYMGQLTVSLLVICSESKMKPPSDPSLQLVQQQSDQQQWWCMDERSEKVEGS